MAEPKKRANAQEELAEHVAAFEVVVNVVAKEVRKREICPICFARNIVGFFGGMAKCGALKHDNEYSEEERAESPFFTESVPVRMVAVTGDETQH